MEIKSVFLKGNQGKGWECGNAWSRGNVGDANLFSYGWRCFLLHVVLFCVACPKIAVLKDLFLKGK
jgi:hypothetical protein